MPVQICDEWNQIKTDLENVREFRIERWYQCDENDKIELHGFCDASMKAYACVVYCKLRGKITLAASKARLNPENKKMTLPRLELCGAHLLSKLVHKLKTALSDHHVTVFTWTDSTAVLGWLQGDTGRWKPFVANRVNQIKEIIPSQCWRYIKSAENPADCASRGISAEKLKEHSLWWNGPNFLPTFCANEVTEKVTYTTEEELKKSKQSCATTCHKGDNVIKQLIDKHSNMTRLVRVLAWVLRITTRHREASRVLTMGELNRAKYMIIKYIQHMEFAEEIEALQSGKLLHNKSKILNLNPFLDKNGLLKVG